MKWLDALKIFNKDHQGAWCIPKKGTPEYKTVVDIMNGKHMRRQEKIQGSGMINDWLKKISAKTKARESPPKKKKTIHQQVKNITTHESKREAKSNKSKSGKHENIKKKIFFTNLHNYFFNVL